MASYGPIVREDEKAKKHRAMREALCEAKSNLYEARHQASESAHDMADRISEVYAIAERLWLDAWSNDEKLREQIEQALDTEYGPRNKITTRYANL
jgi:RNA polymerase-binding transcription factor DksA